MGAAVQLDDSSYLGLIIGIRSIDQSVQKIWQLKGFFYHENMDTRNDKLVRFCSQIKKKYHCLYPHTPRDSVYPVGGIFTMALASSWRHPCRTALSD